MRASGCTCHPMSSLQRCGTCLEAQKKLALFQQTHDSICVHMPPHEQAAKLQHLLGSPKQLIDFIRHMRASVCTCHTMSRLQVCCPSLKAQKNLALFQQTHDSISVHMPPHEQAAKLQHLHRNPKQLIDFSRHMRASGCTCHPMSSLQRCGTCLEAQKKLALFQQTHDSICVHMPPHEQAAKLQHLLGSPKQLIDFIRHMRASVCTCHTMSRLQVCCPSLKAQKNLALFQQSISVHMPPHEQAAELQHLLGSPKQLIDFSRHMRASGCTCHPMSSLQRCCTCLEAQKKLALFQQTHDSICVHMPPHEQAAKLQHLLGSPKQLIDFSRHMRASGCTCHPMSSLQRCGTCLEAQKKLALFQQTHDSICVHMPPHEQAAKLQHLLGSPKQLIDFIRHMRASVCTCHTMSRLQVCCPSLKAQKNLALFQQTHDSICVHMPPHEQAAKLQHLLGSPKQLIDFIRHMRASVWASRAHAEGYNSISHTQSAHL